MDQSHEEINEGFSIYDSTVTVKIPVLGKFVEIPADEYQSQLLGIARELLFREPHVLSQIISVKESERGLTAAAFSQVAVDMARSLVLNVNALVAQDIVDGVTLDTVSDQTEPQGYLPTIDPKYRQD